MLRFEWDRRERGRVELPAVRPRRCARDELGARVVVRDEQAIAVDDSGDGLMDDISDARQVQGQVESKGKQ